MKTKKMVISGASGVVGAHLMEHALKDGWDIAVLTHSGRAKRPEVKAVAWDPEKILKNDTSLLSTLREALEGAEVLVNLSGSSVDGDFSEKHRQGVIRSREASAQALLKGFEACEKPPQVWFQASAVGFYGETGNKVISESSPKGNNFLSEVCLRWEGAAKPVLSTVSPPRFVVGRIGIVLGKNAPAWMNMIKPIKMGAGGPLGSGKQYYAWIDADDLARSILFLAKNPEASGEYNLTAPEPVPQIDLVKAAAKILKRPSFAPAPRFVLKMILGPMVDEFLLVSCRAVPERLQKAGFSFHHSTIQSAAKHLLT